MQTVWQEKELVQDLASRSADCDQVSRSLPGFELYSSEANYLRLHSKICKRITLKHQNLCKHKSSKTKISILVLLFFYKSTNVILNVCFWTIKFGIERLILTWSQSADLEARSLTNSSSCHTVWMMDKIWSWWGSPQYLCYN